MLVVLYAKRAESLVPVLAKIVKRDDQVDTENEGGDGRHDDVQEG